MYNIWLLSPLNFFAFKILTNEICVIETIYLYFGEHYTAQTSVTKCIYEVKIIKHMEHYDVLYADNRYKTIDPIKTLFKLYMNEIYNIKNYYLFHGAAIELNKKTILLLGHTHMGKSTLTAYILKMGGAYLTDDCVMISNKSIMVCPFTLPIHLRKGGVELLSTYFDDFNKYIRKLKFTDRYIYNDQSNCNTSRKIHAVVFITLDSIKNSMVPLNNVESFLQLTLSACIPYDLTNHYLDFISKLSMLPSYKVKYGKLENLYELLLDL